MTEFTDGLFGITVSVGIEFLDRIQLCFHLLAELVSSEVLEVLGYDSDVLAEDTELLLHLSNSHFREIGDACCQVRPVGCQEFPAQFTSLLPEIFGDRILSDL